MGVVRETVQLHLLGDFRLSDCEQEIRLAPAAERLLAHLALRGVGPRNAVAFLLWADHGEEQALGCLRTAMWRLPKPGGRALIRADASRLQLAPHVEVDLRLRTSQADAWETSGAPPDGLRAGDYRADVLPDWYDDWLIIGRERYRQLRMHLLERLSAWLTANDRFAEAIATGLDAVAAEPLRESAHRHVVAAHLAEGNLVEAVRQTRHYLALLDEAGLPCHLSPQMQRLVPLVGSR
jgi:DNA-binding SARP family transcriptional activator